MKNALTIDLEDYYQVTEFAGAGKPSSWKSLESRVEANTAKLLEILSGSPHRATFFTVGWVAEKYPRMVRQIAELGHEIACHSHLHRLVYSLTPAEFREDTLRAKNALEDASGSAVRGYRAPSFSITQESPWAFEVLAGLGFTYDSSLFPITHMTYSLPEGPRFPFRIDTPEGSLVEVPMPTLAFAGARSPFGGGAYFRLLPYAYTRWAIQYVNDQENQPVCVYFHPWELDADQPRIHAGLTARARQYFGLRGTEKKLRRLLQDFEFSPLRPLVDQMTLTKRVSHPFHAEPATVS